jgi:hypothetical protein
MEVADRTWIENIEKEKDKETFHQTKDEDEKELGCETFQIEPLFEKLRDIEDEGSGEGIETERIARKEVHEKPHEDG